MNSPPESSLNDLRWKRMIGRLLERKRWHWIGVKLWLLQRPHLRYLPLPLPMVATLDEWTKQTNDQVNRRTWPRSWRQRALNKMSMLHLRDCQTLRSRMGLELGFMEDEAVMFGLKMLKRPRRARQQGALVAETQLALRDLDGRREELAKELLGPRGGMPRNKGELIKLACLCHVEVGDKDTVDMLREKLRPTVEMLMNKNKVPSMSGSLQPKPKPTAAPPTLPVSQEVLQDRGRGRGHLLTGQWPETMQVPYGWTTEMMDQQDRQQDQSVSPVSAMSINTAWGGEPAEFYQMNDDNDQAL